VAKRSDGGLGFLDRVILFAAWLASCGLVFLLGYYVGKGEQRQRATEVAQRVVLPVEPQGTADTEPATGPTLTFYDQLGRESGSGREPGAGGTPPEPPRPVAAATPATVTTSTRPAPPTTRPRPSSTVPAPPPPPPPVTTSTRPPPPPAAASLPEGRLERGWTVYVNPTRDRFEAERRRAMLAGQGYDTAVVRMQRDGDTWYRVRVGRYPDKMRAESVRQELRERFGVDHAFVLEE